MYTSKKAAGRFITTVSAITLLAVAPAFAQGPVPTTNPYGLDPYAPSAAAFLRNYGAALVAQTPLLELSALDPYKPSDAALLRQLGGAMPLCCPDWYWPGPTFGPLTPASTRGATRRRTPGFPTARGTTASSDLARPAAGAATSSSPQGAPSQPASTGVSTAIRPGVNDGVWIFYNRQIWISAGRAIPRQGSALERVGEYSGFPVYRRAGDDDVIYLPTRDDLVAPYRAKP